MPRHTEPKCFRRRWPKQALTAFSLISTMAVSPTWIGCSSKPAEPPPVIEATLVGSGTIVGRVTLEGTPPEQQQLPLDPACSASCKSHGVEVPRFTRTYVTKDGGLGDVLVALIEIPPQPLPAGTGPLTIDQRGCEYLPYVTACQVGQTIQVTNLDSLTHNIHTLPRTSGNKEVNKSQAAGAKALEFVYDKAEEFLTFKCNVHPWMFSYVSVLNHPFFAVTSEDGHFEIKGLPDGKYKVKFRHRKAGEKIEEIEVKNGQATVDVVLDGPGGLVFVKGHGINGRTRSGFRPQVRFLHRSQGDRHSVRPDIARVSIRRLHADALDAVAVGESRQTGAGRRRGIGGPVG